MATSNSSSFTVPKHYDQFEELYNQTLMHSPTAKFFQEKLSSDAKKVPSTLQNDKEMKSPRGKAPRSRLMSAPIPKTRGAIQQHLLSPAAKIIQQMKTKYVHDNRNGVAEENNKTVKSNKPMETRSKRQSSDKEETHGIDIPSFDCSDGSSDSSSDLSDDEQTVTKPNRSTNHQKHNLHALVQEYRSPEKQTESVTPVLFNRSKSRTPSGEDRRLLKDLQKSLTPEFKAITDKEQASRSRKPQNRNALYRNRRVDLQKKSYKVRKEDKDVDEVASNQQPEDVDGGDELTTEDRLVKQVENVQPRSEASVATIEKPSQDTDLTLVKTPSSHQNTSGVLHKSNNEQDDETPKNTKASSKSETVLDDWFIQMLQSGKGIRLQGHRGGDPPDSFWNSSVITKRVDNATVTTKSGSVYKLEGKMDRLSATEEGFSAKVVKKFRNGFPTDWKEVLSEFMHQNSDKASNSPEEAKVLETPVLIKKRTLTKIPRTVSNKQTPPLRKKSSTNKGAVYNTPQNTVTVKELPRSSSGRMIKPPLAYWVNQRVRHNVAADTVEIIAGGINYQSQGLEKTLTGSTELSQREFERRKRIQLRELKKSQRLHSTSSRELRQLNTTLSKPKDSKKETGNTDPASDSSTENNTDSTQTAAEQSRFAQRKVRQTQQQRERSRKKSIEKIKTLKSACVKNRKPDDSAVVDITDSDKEDDSHGMSGKKQTSLKNKKGKDLKIDSAQNNVKIKYIDHQQDPPAPPRKTRRSKTSVNNLPDVVKSPLYYTVSSEVSSDGASSAQEIKQPSVGQTPSQYSVTGKVPITLRSALLKNSRTIPAGSGSMDESEYPVDTPRTAHLKSDALAHATAIPLSDVKKRMTKPKMLGSSPLDLQREIMSVVMTHKQERIAKMQGRHSKQTWLMNSSSTQAQAAEGTDVYDLDNSSDEFEEIPQKIQTRDGSKQFESKEGQQLTKTNNICETPVETSDSDFTAILKSSSKSQKAKSRTKLNDSEEERSGGRDRLRRSTRNRSRTRSNENNSDVSLTSDGEELDSLSRSRTNTQKATKRKPARTNNAKSKAVPSRISKQKAAKQAEEITIIDSDSESSDSDERISDVSHTSDNDQKKRRVSFEVDPNASSKGNAVNNSSSVRSSTRQSKKNAAQRIREMKSCLNDSESSGTEMLSLRSRNASLNRSKRAQMKEETEYTSEGGEEFIPAPRVKKRVIKKATRKIQKKETSKIIKPKKQGGGARKSPKENERKDVTASGQGTAAAVSQKEEVSPSTEKENSIVKHTREGNEKDWSPVELAKLKSALEVVAPDTAMYWQCVASIVRTKSADLCQLKHQESLEKQIGHKITGKKAKSEVKPVEKKEPVLLTAKKGTLKRKRQLRELVEQHNHGAEADYFDSTPFKIQSKKIKISANLDSDDEDEVGMPVKTPGSARFKTPSVRPYGLAPLSDKKTPHTNLLSPMTTGIINRNYIDTYINGIQKKKKVRTLAQSTPFIKKKISKIKAATNIEVAVGKASAAGLFDVRPASDGSDSEAGSDYYWSDEEEQ